MTPTDRPVHPSLPIEKGEAAKEKDQDRGRALRQPKLRIRLATLADVDALSELSRRVYGNVAYHRVSEIRGQINNFPDGQFVAEYEGRIVGHCATFIVSERLAKSPHTWAEITGHGFASRHNPNGDWLYGMEVSVDPQYRRLRIGQRLYDERRRLCENLELQGIVFGGRMPGLSRRIKQVGSAEAYLEEAQARNVRDPVIAFHLANGFVPIGVLANYLPSDKQSLGYATHMIWKNPLAPEKPSSEVAGTRLPMVDTVRVATVQYQVRGIKSREEFLHQVEYFVDVAADYRADFVTFPELFTLQLLSLQQKKFEHKQAIEEVTTYTQWFIDQMSSLAVSYNINIIGGSHPTMLASGEVRNVSYVFLRDGSVHSQDKIHPTPSEAYWWDIKGGESVDVINTDCGPIGVLICYDSEFPELARHLIDQGAMILFVPFCTDERRGFLRVRYCCHARAIENQCYVVMSGVVGNLPHVDNMDIHYAESAILTPCDFAFARDGVAADTGANTETIAFADLRLTDLRIARSTGSVRNLADRRFDLYRTDWRRRTSGSDT
ncbi:MAG: Hydrolase YhcX [Pseudomonadota bacterium]|jgi:predicted amidohydrolase/predicted N-acetyltransferase YhbS